jgi:hypothetical protein
MSRPRFFFVAGFQRSGSTWLYLMLDSHPDVVMNRPERPEPKFFLDEENLARGLEGYVERFFAQAPPAALLGDKSVSYGEHPRALARIHAWLPDARFLFVARDPVERAISNWRFSRNNGLETLPLDEAIEREEERRDRFDRAQTSASPFAYVWRGMYADRLVPVLEQIPRERVHVVLFEELLESKAARAELFSFLEVDPGHDPDVSQIANASARRAGSIPAGVRERLRDRFAEPNARFGERFQLDVARWWRA